MTRVTNIKRLAEALDAHIVAEVPETGGGAFGAARLARVVAVLRSKLKPSQGLRPGRPTDPTWRHHPKVPMSAKTLRTLRELADEASTKHRRVSPMQVAARILEEAVQ